MKKISLLVIFVCAISLYGCGFLFKKKTVKAPTNFFVQSGRIVQEGRLAEGGKLLIMPFTAGEGVAATEQLDRIALIVVKEISEIIMEKEVPLEILMAHNADDAEMTISGHIVKMDTTKGFKKWVLGKRKKLFGVEGKMIDLKTNKVILYFSHKRETKEKKESFEDLGLMIGQDIGRFIVSGIK